MKKLVFILFLLIINFYLLYFKISSIDTRNAKLRLRKDELGIVILYLEQSTSLLIKKADYSLLYVIEYHGDNDLYETINLFAENIDYVFMWEEYDLQYSYKVVVDGSISINDIIIEKNSIRYQNHSFCIDTIGECDYIYLIRGVDGKVNAKMVLHNDSLSSSYVKGIYDNWGEIYKVRRSTYITLILGSDHGLIKVK